MNDKDKQHRSEEFQELTSKIDRLEKIARVGGKNSPIGGKKRPDDR